MVRLAVTAFVLVLAVIPAGAQRTSAHGGFSAHSAPASRPGFSAPAARPSTAIRSMNPGGYAPRRTIAAPPGIARPGMAVRGNRNPYGRPPYTGSWRYRRPYVPRYGAAIGYYGIPGYSVYGGDIGPGYADTGSDDAPVSQDNSMLAEPGQAAPGDDEQQPDDRELPPWPYGQAGANLPQAPASPASEDSVTLIFKDGRPPEQIHNYILTGTTLYVGGHHADIPVEELDLAATIKVNRDAGVDFRLPVPPPASTGFISNN
jgi:hypothetical protein